MKLFNGILKWLSVLIFSLTAGLLTIIFLSDNPQINPFLLRILILLAIGFFSGFFMRIFFRKGFRIILILFGLITSILAILVIDFFYESEYGFTFITKDFNFQIPSTSDAAQIGLLLLISLPAILFFRRKKTVKTKARSQPKPPRLSFSDRLKPVVYQVNPKNWNIRLPKIDLGPKTKNTSSAQKKPTPSVQISMSPSKTKTNSTKRKTGSGYKRSSIKKIKVPKRRSNHHNNNDVKLMGEEEHVCPYCLEVVEKNDNRGVMICPECHTWHHQDCWAITGGCGVAHRNEL